jgi:hypothetical protein
MKAKTITNSKYRNTGVLFEMLVRQITSDTLQGKSNSPAYAILHKFFNKTTQLGKEIQLYNAFFEAKGLSEQRAIHFIDIVLEQRKNINEAVLSDEKYNLIKEIKKSYDLRDFLSIKIPDYTLHASIYKTFTSSAHHNKNVDIVNIREVANARFTLIEHLTTKMKKPTTQKKDPVLEEYKHQSQELRELTYQLLVEKFNTKYANLNNKQKALLREYINDVSSAHTLYDYIKTEIPELKSKMAGLAQTEPDKVISIKLNEVIAQLDNIGTKKVIKDNEVAALMIAYEITKEIGSSK